MPALVFALLLLLSAAIPASAQEVDRIAAVVNDDVISIRDLDARLKLAITVSGLADNIENRRRAVPQVLRKMVDERLQMQEAGRLKVSVSSEEITRSLGNVENQNRMPPGSLLPSLVKQGVDPDAVKEQVRADIAWVKLIMRSLQPTIRVGEDEITERIEAVRQQIDRPEYMLSEIYLAVENPSQEEEARKLGERLLEQLRAGAPFAALARQFSQSASAANGGMLGWGSEEMLDDEVRDAVVRLEKGQTSPLVRSANGYAILSLLDKRVKGTEIQTEGKVSLVQVFFPLPPAGAGGPAVGQLAAKAAEMTSSMRSCTEMEELARKLNSPQSGRKDNLPLSALPQNLRSLVTSSQINKASQPINIGEALLVNMVCSREEGKTVSAIPSRDAMKRTIEDERLDILAKRYMRDLRRAAFVDFRL